MPQYRVPFFAALLEATNGTDLSFDIFHGDTPPEWKARQDTPPVEFSERLPTTFPALFGKHIVSKSLKPVERKGPYDLIVVEHAVRNVETYRLLLRSSKTPVAFWGHGRTYTEQIPRVQEWLKMSLLRRASWYFSYTDGGRDSVVASGYPRNRVTVLGNTIDTTRLSKDLASVSAVDVDEFRKRNALGNHVVLHLGAIDGPKRIQFSLEAIELISSKRPDIDFLFVGSGSDEDLVRRAARSNPRIRLVGPLFGVDKAIALKASSLLMNPGRVGLVAVDSFTAGLPIVTTHWHSHAPEFEYLASEYNSLVLPDELRAFANGLLDVLSNPSRLARLAAGSAACRDDYSMEAMKSRFLEGTRLALASIGER
jgi:glycosyltransferase involved in cell wall biosynthesis